jgi:hypothetical protein
MDDRYCDDCGHLVGFCTCGQKDDFTKCEFCGEDPCECDDEEEEDED